MRLVVAITGASGAIYGKRLVEVLVERGVEVHLVVTRAGEKVLEEEVGIGLHHFKALTPHIYREDDLEAPFISGSFPTDGMVIAPCSLKTLGAIAHGFGENIVTRGAEVALKEGRPLILVPRETPLTAVHLENMLRLARLGVVILPAMPGFYHKPRRIEDLVDFVVGKILDRLGIEHNLFHRWGVD